MTRYTATLLPTDDDSGDAMLPLPPEIVAALGLQEGSVVDIYPDPADGTRLIIQPCPSNEPA